MVFRTVPAFPKSGEGFEVDVLDKCMAQTVSLMYGKMSIFLHIFLPTKRLLCIPYRNFGHFDRCLHFVRTTHRLQEAFKAGVLTMHGAIPTTHQHTV